MNGSDMMTDREFDMLARRLDFNLSTRNKLLTFSFTTVLAVLGLAFSTTTGQVNIMVYLVPYCLIIPFSARIVYYRLVYARISAYLMVHAPEDMQFSIKGDQVPEKQNKRFTIVALLNNYEMFLLSVACAVTFYAKYPVAFSKFTKYDYALCAAPIVLTMMVGWIITYAYQYGEWEGIYKRGWQNANRFE